MTPVRKRQRARFYLQKSKKSETLYIYIDKKPDTLQKARQFAVHF